MEKENKEKLIKTKQRVKKHGEVFTPKKIVKKMINIPELKEDILDINKKILEPSVGEGAFLVKILSDRLDKIAEEVGDDLNKFENKSLIALTTLYGVELLSDNLQKCTLNIYDVYNKKYFLFTKKTNNKMNQKVLESAKIIIAINLIEGDFLKKQNSAGEPLIFTNWKIVSKQESKNVYVIRTEYTLEDIEEKRINEDGYIVDKEKESLDNQISIFEFMQENNEENEDEEDEDKIYRYIKTNIKNIYKEESERVEDGE